MTRKDDILVRKTYKANRQGITHNLSMTNNTDWHNWADQMDRLGISDWVASMLEAAGPLTLVGAQMIYVCQPMLTRAAPRLNLDSLLTLLEEPENVQSFAALLRKEYKR